MNVSLTDAKSRLTDLVRRVERGEEVVLTRHGQPAARIVPVLAGQKTRDERRKLLEAIWSEARAERLAAGLPDDTAARSQDFLYDDDGLPA